MVNILLAGAIAGLAATLVLTALMRPLIRGQPGPAALIASRLNGRSPEENGAWALALRLGYGTLMGVLLAWGLDAFAGIGNYTFAGLVGGGLLFGVALWLLDGFFWNPVSGMDLRLATVPADVRRAMAVAFLGVYLVYGLVLAAALEVIPAESSAPRLTDGILAAAVVLLGVLLSAGAVTMHRHRHEAAHRTRASGMG